MRASALSLLLALGTAACPMATVRSEPIPRAQFCARFAAAVCAHRDACGCGAATDCSARWEGTCADNFFSAGAIAAFDAVTLVYDGAAAAALVAHVDSRPADCRDFYLASGLTLDVSPTLAGVFVGTLPEGSECAPIRTEIGVPNECVAPAVCSDAGRCTRIVYFGDPCDASAECVDPDATAISFAPLGICTPSAAGAICSPLLDVGATCVSDGECQAARCVSGACAPPLPLGSSCSLDAACSSGVCALTCLEPGTVPPGGACTTSAQCIWENCGLADGVCGPPPFCIIS